MDNKNNNSNTNPTPNASSQSIDLAKIYGMNSTDNNISMEPNADEMNDRSFTQTPYLNQSCINCVDDSVNERPLQTPQLEQNDMNIMMPRANQSNEPQRTMQQTRITTPQRQIEQTLPSTNASTTNATTTNETTTSSTQTNPLLTNASTNMNQWDMLYNQNMNGNNMMNMVNPCGDMSDFLKTQIGKVIDVQFLLGTNALIEKTGVLLGVGTNYIVLRDSENNNVILCNFEDIKFIRFENNTK